MIILSTTLSWSAIGHGQDVQYNRDIRPILSDNCFKCHGPDQRLREAELRLDDRAVAIERGALVSGEPDESEIIARIESGDSDSVMPPPESNKSLTTQQKKLLRKWVEQGAKYEIHWSYLPPTRPQIPAASAETQSPNPVDRFVASQLAVHKLAANAEANRATLLRRLNLDLVGLPPTLEEQQVFLADNSPDAYARAVDRLLASPHFGERMAISWLDVARYADTVGYHGDQNQNVFAYRDWVIDAINRNMPFDRFTEYQLAGDLIENPTNESRTASCFNRLNMMTREGGAQPKEYISKYSADRVRTVAGAWLGSTLGCAECHDHKYDPFSTRDFYQMSAFFADLKQWGVYQDYGYTPNPDLKGWTNDHPFPPEIVVPVPYLERRLAKLQEERDRLAFEAVRKGENDKSKFAERSEWRATLAEFLGRNATGWEPTTASLVGPVEGLTMESAADSSLILTGEKIDDVVLSVSNVSHTIATIRFELLENPEEPSQIFAKPNQTANLQFTWETVAADGKKTPLAIHFSDAKEKVPVYFNNSQLLGIGNLWRVPAQSSPGSSACWILDRPLRLENGDSLSISIKENSARHFRISYSPLVPADASQPDQWSSELDGLQRDARQSEFTSASLVRQWVLTALQADQERSALRKLEQQIRECRNGVTPVQVSEPQSPLETRVLLRGNWQDESGDVVLPAVPHFLPQVAAKNDRRLTRLDLAHWLTAPENPLTARVQMNRLWKHFFGEGLSPVLDDLGIQGQYPSHPELLDWLAIEFRESGWDFKHMVRLIAMSTTYRQSSQPSAEARERDPKNLWLSHQNARRLEAEIIRDNALAAAGLINLDIGGPPVFPYQPPGYYEHLQFPDREYQNDADDRRFRRGVYMHWQRTFLHPMLANFDAPPREECTGMRNEANTPLQALTLLNDPAFVEAATSMAENNLATDGLDDATRIGKLFQAALARSASQAEIAAMKIFLETQRAAFKADPESADRFTKRIEIDVENATDKVELASWASVCRVILNLHETITRY